MITLGNTSCTFTSRQVTCPRFSWYHPRRMSESAHSCKFSNSLSFTFWPGNWANSMQQPISTNPTWKGATFQLSKSGYGPWCAPFVGHTYLLPGVSVATFGSCKFNLKFQMIRNCVPKTVCWMGVDDPESENPENHCTSHPHCRLRSVLPSTKVTWRS